MNQEAGALVEQQFADLLLAQHFVHDAHHRRAAGEKLGERRQDQFTVELQAVHQR